MLSCTALLALLVAASQAVPVHIDTEQDWESFKLLHNKTYTSRLEEEVRKHIFLERREEIVKHNVDFQRGVETFKMSLNHLSDMLPHEIHGSLNTIIGDQNIWRQAIGCEDSHNQTLPKSVDWRLEGAVTPVKNQRNCESCYAFATTGSLEGQIFRKTGRLQSLSEQNLVDCTYRLGTTGGCEGGNVPSAMKYAMVFGVDTEESYSYNATAGRCRRNVTAVDPHTKIMDYQQVQPPTEAALKAAVATIGPVAACFQISPKFDSYETGVFYEADCASYIDTGHCALVVGYGSSDDGQDYWIVKNSMGSEHYGEAGYIRMARNRDNMCGIASFAYYPVL